MSYQVSRSIMGILSGTIILIMYLFLAIQQRMVEDEMAKLIGLKSMRVAFVISTIGFLASMVSLMLGYQAFIMLNIVFVAFFIAGIADGCTRLYYYQRGI